MRAWVGEEHRIANSMVTDVAARLVNGSVAARQGFQRAHMRPHDFSIRRKPPVCSGMVDAFMGSVLPDSISDRERPFL